MKITLHDQIVANFVATHPNYKLFKLRETLNTALLQQDTEPLKKNLRYIPDAFFVNAEKRVVQLFEADGSSSTDDRKMPNLLGLWWELDARGWSLELHTVSVYSSATSVLNDSDFEEMSWSRFWQRTREKQIEAA